MDPRVKMSFHQKPAVADKPQSFPPEQNRLVQISCSKDYQQQNLQLWIYHLQQIVTDEQWHFQYQNQNLEQSS